MPIKIAPAVWVIPRLVAWAALAGMLLGAAREAPVLRRVADIPLPGPALRFDYQSIDTTANRLYISHMEASQLLIFNLAGRRVEGTVPHLPRVTGVCAVPTLGVVYASVPGRHSVAAIDPRTMRVKAWVGSIGFPDGMAYAAGVRKVYVSDESGGGELVIDGATNRAVTTIPLGGEAGNTIYDPGSDRILVAVQTLDEVVEIDPRADRVNARHKLMHASSPHGMALDAAGRLLFVANEGNATLLTFDLRTMRVVDTHPVGGEPDVLAFDPGWGRLYVASESGTVSVFTERDGRLVPDGEITMPHAHTVSVDPRTHLLYVPLQSVQGHPLLRILAARGP
jgi:DNA-binding beta-propeller fold protein YncE